MVKISQNLPPAIRSLGVPAVVLATGKEGAKSFFEFFAANIRNLNTRMAYYRAACTSSNGAKAEASFKQSVKCS